MQLNCSLEFFPEMALARAKELDEYLQKNGKPVGPLHGLPISLKDQFRIKVNELSLWRNNTDHSGTRNINGICLLDRKVRDREFRSRGPLVESWGCILRQDQCTSKSDGL
jgi:hypothetical protein